MIDRIEFHNFKALRETRLSLGRFTLIVGPNGSGKSTALQALPMLVVPGNHSFASLATVGTADDVSVRVHWGPPFEGIVTTATWYSAAGRGCGLQHLTAEGKQVEKGVREAIVARLQKVRIYTLDPIAIAAPVQLSPDVELTASGQGLAGVIDRLRDLEPERFEALNAELARWLPEYNRILFDVPQTGRRAFSLRTRWGHPIAAKDLSHGTLLALAILTLAYVPDPPPLVAFEDPERGIHPRLLREIRDALYRLSYPENYGEQRDPVQVIATTHSPYLLDLYKDHPEEIVIAQKLDTEATFERLSDRPDIEEILQDESLGEIWYSGILGGVPAGT